MKTHSLYLLAVAGGAVFLSLAAPQPISGQDATSAPARKAEAIGEVSPAIQALIVELTAQNKQLVANQAALDARIDELAESIRQARLMSSRARGKGAQ